MTLASRKAKRSAIVVGGSIAGLIAAAFLSKVGWSVDVYERSAANLEGRGAGIVCQPELLATLERLGARTRNIGVEVRERLAFDSSGAVIGRVSLPQTMTSWDTLYRTLRDLLSPSKHHLGYALTQIDQDEHEVRATFLNGRVAAGDLLIGADGIRSSVRRQFLPFTEPEYAGYAIWRGVADEDSLQPQVRDLLFDRFTFHYPPGNGILGYPIWGGETDRGSVRRGYNWAWYKKASEAELKNMLTDAEGKEHPSGISPTLLRPEFVSDMRSDAAKTIAPPLLAVLGAIERPFFNPIADLLSPRFAFGRVALVGDAATLARPHVGYGTAKAAGDAEALARALEADPDNFAAALGAYDGERRPFGERCFRKARLLGAWISGDVPSSEHDRLEMLELQTTEGLLRNAATGV